MAFANAIHSLTIGICIGILPDSAEFESVKILENSMITWFYDYFALFQNFTQWVK